MSAAVDEVRMKWAYYTTYHKIFGLGFPCACNYESVQASQKMSEKDMKTIDTILMNCTDDLAYLFIFREMNGLNDGKFKDGSDISGLRDKDTMNLKQQGSSQGRRAINEDSEIKAKSRLASLKNYFLQKSISFFDYEEAER